MRIGLSEIWNFLDLVERSEKGWNYSLIAGATKIEGISLSDMELIKKGASFDTELLPSIFTFREILWQPDVFTEASMSIPSLRILKAFCDETSKAYEEEKDQSLNLYAKLIRGLGSCSEKAVEALNNDRVDVKRVLGSFRTCAFPIVKFFIYHPQNREDYFQDAQNRLNYAVKIMLTQFYGRYTALEDPYWMVYYSKPSQGKTIVKTNEKIVQGKS